MKLPLQCLLLSGDRGEIENSENRAQIAKLTTTQTLHLVHNVHSVWRAQGVWMIPHSYLRRLTQKGTTDAGRSKDHNSAGQGIYSDLLSTRRGFYYSEGHTHARTIDEV